MHDLGRDRRTTVAISFLGVAVCLLTAAPQTPFMLWNASASMPIGLYAVSSRSPGLGETAVVDLPSGIRELAARRRYLPPGIPALKRVAALAGDRICARGAFVFINERLAAARQSTDALGRPLASWHGCQVLRREVFLLGEGRGSFDGRYFGPLDQARVTGSARLLWAW